jgi:hypothetical protein
VLLDHFELAVHLHGEARASRLMRKFGIRFALHHPRPEEAKAAFIACRSLPEWRAVIEREYGEAAYAGAPA